MKDFPRRLIALRQKHGMKQTDFAEPFHLSERTIRNYENGSQVPRLDAAAALAEYFGVSLDYLTGRTDNPEVNR